MTLTVGRNVVTQVWVGNKSAGTIIFRGVQVWPPAKPWLKTFVDEEHHTPSGFWTGVNDLSAMPAPVKGSLVFSVFITPTGQLTETVQVFNGTSWVESNNSFNQAFNVDLHGATAYSIGKWWNSADGETDWNNWVMNPLAGPPSGEACVGAWSASDGIHIAFLDQNGAAGPVYIEPYPAGVTLADMPTSRDLT